MLFDRIMRLVLGAIAVDSALRAIYMMYVLFNEPSWDAARILALLIVCAIYGGLRYRGWYPFGGWRTR